MLPRRRRPWPRLQTGKPLNQGRIVCPKRRKRATTRSNSGKGPQRMNVMATTTTLPHAGACGEPIGLFHSSSEDISPAAGRDPAAKNLVLPGRARCLGPSGESLNMEAPQPYPCSSFSRTWCPA